jgi:hypothetical protein
MESRIAAEAGPWIGTAHKFHGLPPDTEQRKRTVCESGEKAIVLPVLEQAGGPIGILVPSRRR